MYTNNSNIFSRRRGDSMLTNTMKEDLTQGVVDLFSDSILAIILYGSVARNDNTDESDIDIVIIIKNEMDDATKEQFIHWSAELDLRYDRVFSIIDIQEENMEKWGNVLPFYQGGDNSLESRITIPFTLHGIEENLTVEYTQGTDPREIGYDALQGFPIDKICCIGYPVMHGYFEHMNATGYRRSCGFIQFVERIENYGENRELSIDVSDENLGKGNPYFAYGYPAEIFDAPCCNLAGCRHLKWTAYTYLVDLPSRMNSNKLKFLGGYSWGYEEDENGPQRLLPLEILTENDWEKHATEKGILTIFPIKGAFLLSNK